MTHGRAVLRKAHGDAQPIQDFGEVAHHIEGSAGVNLRRRARAIVVAAEFAGRQRGLLPPIDVAGLNLKNRIKVAMLNLNFLSVLSYIFIRSTQFILKYKTFQVVKIAYNLMKDDLIYIKNNRKVISFKTYWKLAKINGPILF